MSTLYLAVIVTATAISLAATPLVRVLALRFGWMDDPSSLKGHKASTPSLGGLAIFLAFTGTLVLLRFTTQFPTGTLHKLWALVIGAALILILGAIDDLKKPEGLHFRIKFLIQGLAAMILLSFDLQIDFIAPDFLAKLLTFLWVVGVTNAFNLIDIMDGLSASQAAIAAAGFLMISLPSEELYVNLASAALFGAALGFIPWNLSNKHKIFMGDSGSLFLGFVLAALSLGTKYSRINDLGVYAPVLILAVPLYDTFFVMFLRLRKGHSPFLGSKDHFALRMEKLGCTRGEIVVLAAAGASFLGFCGFLVTMISAAGAICIYAAVLVGIILLSVYLAEVSVE